MYISIEVTAIYFTKILITGILDRMKEIAKLIIVVESHIIGIAIVASHCT